MDILGVMNSTKDILSFDIETTGINTNSDRIVEFSATKISSIDFKVIKKTTFLINPTIPIPQEATKIHKITNEMVFDKKPFSYFAKPLLEFISDCIIVTYNGNRFDIPLLYEEFSRCGIEWDISNLETIDAFSIFREKEPRNLKAAIKFYLGIEISELDSKLHSAETDVAYTIEVLESQIFMYGLTLQETIDLTKKGNEKNVDFEGKIILNDKNIPIWNFGKHKDKNIAVVDDLNYCNWILNNEFSSNTKNVIRKILSNG